MRTYIIKSSRTYEKAAVQQFTNKGQNVIMCVCVLKAFVCVLNASDVRRAYNPVGIGRSLQNTFILRAMPYDPFDKARNPVNVVVLRPNVRRPAASLLLCRDIHAASLRTHCGFRAASPWRTCVHHAATLNLSAVHIRPPSGIRADSPQAFLRGHYFFPAGSLGLSSDLPAVLVLLPRPISEHSLRSPCG